MDSSGTGSNTPSRTISRGWPAPSREPPSPGQTTATRPLLRAPLQPPPRRTLRGPVASASYPRSISLPQALHTLSLSNRSGYAKVSSGQETTGYPSSSLSRSAASTAASTAGHRMASQGEGNDEPSPESYTRDSSKTTANTQRDIFTDDVYHIPSARITGSEGSSSSMMLSPPSPKVTKRVISETHPSPLRLKSHRFPRSETDPHLTEIVQTGETQLLDPLPHDEDDSNSISDFDYDVAECLFYNEAKPHPHNAAEKALSNPDILHHIFDALDAMTVIPHELVQQRRKPLSLRHAQLIFGDNKHAVEAWEQSQPTTTGDSPGAGLYNCLFVNSAWHDAAVRVLEDRIHFRTNESWTRFARRGAQAITRKPRMLVLHKLSDVTQVELDLINRSNLGENLEWLEFYTCLGLAPPTSLIGPELTRIILPGCYRVDDRNLAQIALTCSRLEHLDVRACEQVSDRGVKMISKYCPLLKLINVGRTRGGEKITYKGIKHLARQTQVTTLGIAGCNIDDRAIWELALNRGPELQRLSLNNCRLLTDASVPRVLGYMPNLTVLEIRGCTQMTHMRPIALFKAYREKQGQPPLIEGCEVIERRLQIAIMRLQRETSHRILAELSAWINLKDDDDLCH